MSGPVVGTRTHGTGALASLVRIALVVAVGWPAMASGQEAVGARNAVVRAVDAGQDLAADLARLIGSAGDPSWIAYEVPMVPGGGRTCCWNEDHGGVCRLEGHGISHGEGHDDGIDLEPSTLRVWIRAVDGRADRLRTFTPDCTLDVGGLPVAWVRGVAVGASVAALRQLVEGSGALGSMTAEQNVAEAALAALAWHDSPDVLPALASWARAGSGSVQESAVFWLGAARGRDGLPVLEELVRDHPDPDVRERATFGLHVTGTADAVDVLIQVARDDGDAGVRAQALFWLAQSAGERAAAAIEGAVAEDPDLEVRKRAVFALSQLPADRGVPLLIRIARTHAQPEVRKQAIFWLGQSGDERALDFIEELLRG